MKRARRPASIAICYDFDGTLAPGNMQEYGFIPKLGIKDAKKFWQEARERAIADEADNVLSYMCLMLDKARASDKVRIARKDFVEYGSSVKLFPGVKGWFKRMNAYGEGLGVKVEHYIISSGLREMIEGSPIAGEFRKIYASSFRYDQNGVAVWPAMAINYTTKTQFLFRINKGELDKVWDDKSINKFIERSRRPVPFTRMVYIGDGATDIPCMKLVKSQGGFSFAVYSPGSQEKRAETERLLEDDRVNFAAPADYSPGSPLDAELKAVLRKMAADWELEELAAPEKPRG